MTAEGGSAVLYGTWHTVEGKESSSPSVGSRGQKEEKKGEED